MQALATKPLSACRPVGRVFAVPVVASTETRKARVQERHRRLRRKLSGDTTRPRLAVYRSNEHIYAQVIDDSKGQTLAAASTLTPDIKAACEGNGGNKAAAELVGKKIAELCKAKNIDTVAFDRGGFMYHGRVAAVADGARAGGLVF